MPADYFVAQSAYHILGGQYKLINIVEDKDFDRLLTHSIEFPTDSYPILNVQATTIRVRPVSVKFVVFTYLVKPQPVTYAVADTHGFMEFDAAHSSPVLWNEENIVFIVQNILQNLGIPLSTEQIKQKTK
jgi:hypothetical protein